MQREAKKSTVPSIHIGLKGAMQQPMPSNKAILNELVFSNFLLSITSSRYWPEFRKELFPRQILQERYVVVSRHLLFMVML